MKVVLLLALALIASCANASDKNDDLVLSPVKFDKSAPQLGFVFLQGAQLSTHRYVPLMEKLQQIVPNLYIGLPALTLEFAVPATALTSGGVKRIVNKMQDAGMNDDAHIYFGGHSLGGAAIQDYIPTIKQNWNVKGQVLMGSVLLRKHAQNYSFPTLNLGGEVDGLLTVARVAEAYHSMIELDKTGDAYKNFPVVVLPGVSHLQFASGAPPKQVKSKDLQPQVTLDQAHDAISAAIAAFMHVQSETTEKSASASQLAQSVAESGEFLKPLIEAFKLEGFIHFKKHCNSDHPSPHCPYYPAYPAQESRTPSTDTTCECGCKWVEKVGMSTMANVNENDYPLHVVDAFHKLSDMNPFHHPQLWNDCIDQSTPCTLNLTTVTELIYPKLDDFDAGFTLSSAQEIRVKFKSRQCIVNHSTDKNAPMEETDKPSICGEINEKAYVYALEHAGDKAMERFKAHGQQIVIGEDLIPKIKIGPSFTNWALQWKEKTLHGESVMEVSAPTFKLDQNGSWIDHVLPDKKTGGTKYYHYCKLLSPARAMEWVYVEGLRQNMNIH